MYERMLTVIRVILSADVQSCCIVFNVSDFTIRLTSGGLETCMCFAVPGSFSAVIPKSPLSIPTEDSVIPHFN